MTLPMVVWLAIGSTLTTAVVWLTRTWKAQFEKSSTDLMQLTREVAAALTSNTEVVREQSILLRELSELVRRQAGGGNV